MKKLAAALVTSLFATVAFAQASAPVATAPAAAATAPATKPAPAHKSTKHIHKFSVSRLGADVKPELLLQTARPTLRRTIR
ncbi:hypothetical protein PPMP20_02405 [Paraburkholderia phymatum]|nr:hypothetical protein [Paraburkholderia phymatum]